MRALNALVGLALAVALVGCSSDDGGDEKAKESKASAAGKVAEAGATKEAKPEKPKATKKPKAKYDCKAFAKKVQGEMETALGGPIGDRCDYSDMRWHCFFDHYESPLKGRIDVHLSFPGDVSKSEKKEFAKQARLHTFNLAGYSDEGLKQVVSFNDGVDSGTTNRKDVPLLN